MQKLIKYISSRISITADDQKLLEEYFVYQKVPANTVLLQAGNRENFLYFLSSGIVRGYQNVEGKIVIKHLVQENDFFTSLESFNNRTPSDEYYETITESEVLKISKSNFDLLIQKCEFFAKLVKQVTDEHLNCKLERVQDFQVLTAKQRYLKFLEQNPDLILQVSIDNIASFLGMEPQSLSRIRKQVVF